MQTTTPAPTPTSDSRLPVRTIIGYSVLIIIGIGFALVTIGAFGNVLGWLAGLAAAGLIGVPAYALITRHRIRQLSAVPKILFWLSVLAALCFVVLMILVIFALRNNFS